MGGRDGVEQPGATTASRRRRGPGAAAGGAQAKGPFSKQTRVWFFMHTAPRLRLGAVSSAD